MKLSFAPCDPRLANYIAAYYLFEEGHTIIDDAQRADCGQLRFFLEGTGFQVLPNGTKLSVTPAMLTGPHMVASRFSVTGPLRFAGCSLHTHAWQGFVRIDASEISDGGCDAVDTLRISPLQLIENLKSCRTIEEMAPLLDSYFLQSIRPIPKEHDIVNECIRAWLRADFFPNVDTLYPQCPVGERQVMRIANRYWGAAPRTLARKYGALRTACWIMKNGGDVPEPARKHYSDHPHLIREVKRVTAMTPKQLLSISNMILRATLSDEHFRELEPVT